MNKYRICRPGKIAERVASREEAMAVAMGYSMEAAKEGNSLPSERQQTAYVWMDTKEGHKPELIATFYMGREVKRQAARLSA